MTTIKSRFFKDFKNQKNYKNFKPAGFAQVFRIRHQTYPIGTPIAKHPTNSEIPNRGK